jgi:hypothetical protein
MTVQMMVMNTAEGARAVGNAIPIFLSIPKTGTSSWYQYFTANVSGAVSSNIQCSPSQMAGGIKANTLANTPPLTLTGVGPMLHIYTNFTSTSGVGGNTFHVKLYAGNTVAGNSGATIFPPNTSLQRVITIADAGSDAGGNTWGGYMEWDVADAGISLQSGTSSGFANAVTYAWDLPGGKTSNTTRPWAYTTSANVGNITILYQY